jgi:hypothetical protein
MDKMLAMLDAALGQLDSGNVGAARVLVEHVRNELCVARDVADEQQIVAALVRNSLRAER